MKNYNKNSSSGVAEDALRAIREARALENHQFTLMMELDSKWKDSLNADELDTDALERVMEDVRESVEDMLKISQIRRKRMKYATDIFNNKGDEKKWCSIKHVLGLIESTFEIWQADPTPENFEDLVDVNELTIKFITKWLGVEITSCAACFGDILKATERGEVDDNEL